MTLQRIGVIGAGTMGSGIAQVAAQSGLQVTLYDVSEAMLNKAIAQIKSLISRAADKGRIAREEAGEIIQRVKTTSALDTLSNVEFVVEAAPEKLELKQALFGALEDIVSPDTVLATNTSTLSVTAIAAGHSRPDRIVGMHFFNPPPLMPLVEIIGGTATSEETVRHTLDLATRMGKTPVRVKDTPGFIVNRVARPFYLESLRLLSEGVADHTTIDRLIRGGGQFRMGPFELMDLIGLDINYAASRSVYEAYFYEPRFRPSLLQQRMVESGRLGRKTGRGWYEYPDDNA